MFRSVLIANRGEIALRILRACRAMDLRVIVVHSEADRDASYVRHADAALCIGPAPAQQSYLNGAAILLAAEVCGAEAIHPGYGFLSENADFADQVEASGLTFIGPTAQSMRIMGDKIAAKQAMRAAGVPCVPGSDGALPLDPSAAQEIANEIGYPLILKAAGGGGGRGMRVVEQESDLLAAAAMTREEARRAFNNSAIYAERFLRHPRHVEIQVIADSFGHAVWLGSRDCSLQRRHQKVLEEAPAPGVDAESLARVGERCVEACRQIGYRGVGTFEFLYEDGSFFFIEMNTRLQVEHPVTEATSGLDIVQMQIRMAQGERLTLQQSDVACRGQAFECRINAEDPDTFAPSPGLISTWEPPGGPGVRFDSHAFSGYRVPRHYDSLIGKLIVHGATRADALARLRVALDEMAIGGIATNLPLHRRIVADPDFIRGEVDIHHLENRLRVRNHA
ncbi:acetyl-CoA carboxylase biotin carboxylase subunit [Terrarubrum flagellatum]|uniref:acetyl-CoA carboxylase biotin carboxylase subunit n=1 Tax=Terrirubrum flagellatum TaxID=2895980 RepID=UPI0031454506